MSILQEKKDLLNKEIVIPEKSWGIYNTHTLNVYEDANFTNPKVTIQGYKMSITAQRSLLVGVLINIISRVLMRRG